MIGDALRWTWFERARRLVYSRISFVSSIGLVLGIALVAFGAQTIVSARSIKYPVSLIVVALAAILFLVIPKKPAFLLFVLGLTMPYYVEIILFERGAAASGTVSGTLSIAVLLLVVLLSVDRSTKAGVVLELRVLIPAFGFLCAALLSSFNTTDKTVTILAMMKDLEMVLIFLVLSNAICDESLLLIFLRGFYLGFWTECLIYVIQNLLGFSFDILGNTRMVGATDVESGFIGAQRGTFANDVATPALYFSVLTLTLTGVFLCRKKLPVGLKAIVGMVLGAGCLILSSKRAPMGSLVLGLMVILLLLPIYCPGAIRRLLPLVAVLAVPTLILLPVLLLRARADHEAAYHERMNLTRVAWNMFEAHPVVGIGYGTYADHLRDYLPEDWSGWLFTVHNCYLRTLAETGLIGFSTYVLWLGLILKTAFEGIRRTAIDYRPLQISLVAALVAILWEQYWDVFVSHQQGYILWFVASLAIIVPRVLNEKQSPVVA